MKKYDTFFMSEKQIEQMKRKRKWNKKMTKAAILYLIGTAAAIAIGFVPDYLLGMNISKELVDLIEGGLGLIGGMGSIGGVCTFAKALHDPLTEKEAQELARKEELEKTGEIKKR